MITEKQAEFLQYVAGRKGLSTLRIFNLLGFGEQAPDEIHQLWVDGMVQEKWIWSADNEYASIHITDTGRLALEEFEGAQAVSADASPVVSDAAKIAALEAENAALRGLLAKALDAIAPVEVVVSDEHITNKPDYAMLLVEDMNSIKFQVEALSVGKSDCDEWMFFNAGHLRAIAIIAADIRTALDPTTPYEDTPDGSDLLARDTEADDDE